MSFLENSVVQKWLSAVAAAATLALGGLVFDARVQNAVQDTEIKALNTQVTELQDIRSSIDGLKDDISDIKSDVAYVKGRYQGEEQ